MATSDPYDTVLGIAVAAWIASFVIPLVIPAMRLDSSASLVLMCVAGGLLTFRRPRSGTRT